VLGWRDSLLSLEFTEHLESLEENRSVGREVFDIARFVAVDEICHEFVADFIFVAKIPEDFVERFNQCA